MPVPPIPFSCGNPEVRGIARRRHWLALAGRFCLAAGLFALAGGAAGAQAFHCEAIESEIKAADPADSRTVCEGARAAVAFFQSAGFRTEHGARIEITDAVPAEASPTAAGCFLERDRRLVLVTYARFRRYATWFGQPITRELYRSLAAHEMGHALAHCNFGIPNPGIVAKEYVANVAMFRTMRPALRERILRNYREDPAPDTQRITEMLFLFDPMRFGVRSYLHFSQPENGTAFLRAVFDGKALQD